jgi:hypothetical protein
MSALSRHPWLAAPGRHPPSSIHHPLRPDPAVKLFAAQVTQGQRRLPQGQAAVVGVFGDGGGLVLADRWGEGCDQHQAAGEQAPASRSASLA